jgi:hypothetical protein
MGKKARMQASAHSGDFFTVGISFLEKKFWKIGLLTLRKIRFLDERPKGKTGKGFYVLLP